MQLILESWGRWLGKNWEIALVLTHEEQGGGHTEHMDKGEEGLEVERGNVLGVEEVLHGEDDGPEGEQQTGEGVVEDHVYLLGVADDEQVRGEESPLGGIGGHTAEQGVVGRDVERSLLPVLKEEGRLVILYF